VAGAVRVLLPQAGRSLLDYRAPAEPVTRGQLVQVPVGRRTRLGVVWATEVTPEVAEERLKPVAALWTEWPALEATLLDQIAFASDYYLCEPGEFLVGVLPAGLRRRKSEPALAKLLNAWLERQWAGSARTEPWPKLTAAQEAAWQALRFSFDRFDPVLLFGVTGSGKSELYWRVVGEVLARRRQVLLLVPEIGLVPQTVARLRERFPNLIYAAVHSEQSEGERQQTFAALLTGAVDLIVGTRSAIFAPLPRLGAIIVDEEHDPSYRQFEGVPYSARDLALWRGKRAGVPVLLGSATPSLARWVDTQRGRLRRIDITERATGVPLPTVRLVAHDRSTQVTEGLAESVWAALAATLSAGEQALIFLNRRGYAPILLCPHCGWHHTCRRCSVRLVFHRVDARMRCHHCGWSEPVPAACPECGQVALEVAGQGTQRLEAALAARFPDVRRVRVDRDAVPTAEAFAQLRGELTSGAAQLLIGTQMLAKGHDFPQLTLVVVADADAGLLSGQWQASERLMQQLMQVAGRAGRADKPGTVFVQTRYPDHPFFQTLVRHDYAAFASALLTERRQLQLPPYVHQAVLRADAPRLEAAIAFLAAAKERAEELIAAHLAWQQVRLFDIVPLRVVRLAGRERAQLLVEAPSRQTLLPFLRAWYEWLRNVPRRQGVHWRLWGDPEES